MSREQHQNSVVNLHQLINSHPTIKSYFAKYVTLQNQFQTIQQMILQAIQFIQVKHQNGIKTNKYNVAYVKHNRFLSPSQKQEITPKVTEIIPLSNEKTHVIYGKPKIRPIIESGCVEHQPGYCPIEPPVNLTNKKFNQEHQNLNLEAKNTQNYIKTLKSVQKKVNLSCSSVNDQQKQQQIQIYLKPIKSPPPKSKNIKIQTTAAKSPQIEDSQYDKFSNFRSPKNVGHTKSAKVLHSKYKHSCEENYKQVQSKIKHLIDRDKTESKLRNQLQKQKLKSRQLQRKQNQLIKKFKERQENRVQQYTRQYRPQQEINQFDQSSSDQSSSIQSQLVRKYSEIRRKKLLQGQRLHHDIKNNSSRQVGFLKKHIQEEQCNCSCQSMSENKQSDSNESQYQKFDVKAYLESNIPSFR